VEDLIAPHEGASEQHVLYQVALLSDEFLNALVAELDNDAIVGIILGGSHVRGEATPYSDVDFACFVPDTMQPPPKRYMYRDGHLVSVAFKTVASIRSALTQPESAIWVASGFMPYRLLLDKDGSVSALMQDVANFTWEPLQPAADRYASYRLMLFAEMAHKILSGLSTGNAGAISYAAAELTYALTEAVAVRLGVLVRGSSTYYQQVQDAVGADSAWARYHRIATGVVEDASDASPVQARGIAMLRLYRETATLFQPILQPQHREVIEQALRIIERAGW
jgi:predicted nucleotidyltransferase